MPGSSDRRRQSERERYLRQQASRLRKAERNRTIRAVVTSVVIVVVVVGGMSVVAYKLSAAANKSQADASTPPSSAPQSTPPTSPPPGTCAYNPGGQAAKKLSGKPSTKPAKGGYTATLATNRGDLRIALDAKAPCTVNSFTFLTQQKFYDKTPCHRMVVKGGLHVLQCGDPTGQGTGGPGYQYFNENTDGATYAKGTVAMANTGQPGSNGSQFFICYADTKLPPQYTVFGHVTGGLGIVTKVAKAGVTGPQAGRGDGAPKKKVTIEKVTVSKK